VYGGKLLRVSWVVWWVMMTSFPNKKVGCVQVVYRGEKNDYAPELFLVFQQKMAVKKLSGFPP
jgi:hypothetical protein